jgi:AraC family transcriptional regulator
MPFDAADFETVSARPGPIAFAASGLSFELEMSSPQDFRHDGARPKLLFTFDAGEGIGAFQDAPARGVSCPPGSFVLMTPGFRAHVKHKAPLELLSITYGADALAGRADISGYVEAMVADLPFVRTDPGMKALAQEARRVLLQEAMPDGAYMSALGEAMLARALQAIDQGAQPGRMAISPFKLRRVVDHIEARLETRISVAELADLAQLSTAHFARAFRRATGEAPHHFILGRRIERVRDLLRDTTLDLTTVALRAGFSSHAHMSSAFQKQTGVTPAGWRGAVTEAAA